MQAQAKTTSALITATTALLAGEADEDALLAGLEHLPYNLRKLKPGGVVVLFEERLSASTSSTQPAPGLCAVVSVRHLPEDADDLCGSQDLLSEDCHGLSGPVHNLPEPRDILCGRGRHGLSEPAHRVCGASHPLPASPNLLPCFPDPVSCRWRTGYGLPEGRNPVPPGGYRLPVWPAVLRCGADGQPGF